LSKKRCGIQTFFSTTTYAAIPSLGVFKPGAKHPVTPAPIKALPCLCFFPPMAEKPKPPAPRVAGGPEHYYGKRYKITGFILASFFNKFRSNRTMKGLKLKNLVYLFCWKIKIS